MAKNPAHEELSKLLDTITGEGTSEVLDINLLQPWAANPRMITEDMIKAMATSIQSEGQLVPVLVHKTGTGAYRIIDGECRYRALLSLKATKVWVNIREYPNEEAAYDALVVANFTRSAFDAIAEGEAIETMVERATKLGGAENAVKNVAGMLGQTTTWIGQRLALASLLPAWKEAYRNPAFNLSRWSTQSLALLASLPKSSQQAIWTASSKKGGGYDWASPKLRIHAGQDPMTRAEMGQALARTTGSIQGAPFDTKDVSLVPTAGACGDCPKRSSCRLSLFDNPLDLDKQSEDRCLDLDCYNLKYQRSASAVIAKAAAKDSKVIVAGAPKGVELPAGVSTITHDKVWSMPVAKASDPKAVKVVSFNEHRPEKPEITYRLPAGTKATPVKSTKTVGKADQKAKLAEVYRKQHKAAIEALIVQFDGVMDEVESIWSRIFAAKTYKLGDKIPAPKPAEVTRFQLAVVPQLILCNQPVTGMQRDTSNRWREHFDPPKPLNYASSFETMWLVEVFASLPAGIQSIVHNLQAMEALMELLRDAKNQSNGGTAIEAMRYVIDKVCYYAGPLLDKEAAIKAGLEKYPVPKSLQGLATTADTPKAPKAKGKTAKAAAKKKPAKRASKTADDDYDGDED